MEEEYDIPEGDINYDEVIPPKNADISDNQITRPTAERYIAKANSINILQLPKNATRHQFAQEIRRVVEHHRDVTYVISVFTSYWVIKCIRDNEDIPNLLHTKFVYPIISIITRLRKQQTTLYNKIRQEFNDFVDEMNKGSPVNEPLYDPERFKSIQYSTVLSTTAKTHTELIKNYIAENYEK
ncbi:MAG: hypothetical protein EXX96DRAFT_617621 [Benjaminiella poitrasii]|nr:MAG: hypothetical protein EXX96DRAFT_617621 [Benjaminiella poitrasii]